MPPIYKPAPISKKAEEEEGKKGEGKERRERKEKGKGKEGRRRGEGKGGREAMYMEIAISDLTQNVSILWKEKLSH